MDYFKDLISTADLAAECGLTLRRIQQLADTLIENGLAKRIGKPLVVHRSAIEWINNLPENRGQHFKKDAPRQN